MSRRHPEAGIALESLTSRCTTPGARGHERLDPYWDVPLWDAGANALWLSQKTAQRMAQAGVARPTRAELSMSVPQATAALAARPGRARRLAALAAVACFRTLTVQQAAAIVGSRRVMDNGPDRLALWGSGLVQRGRFMTVLPNPSLPGLLRVGNQTGLDLLASMLDHRELVGVTGGQPWRRGSQFDRHNLITAELLLRLAEYTPAAMVAGEHLAALAALAPGALNAWSHSSADGVVVRADGFRIAVEVTTNTRPETGAKVARWVQLLSHPGAANMAVLWLDVSHPDLPARDEIVRPLLRRHVGEQCTTMAARMARVTERMLVARYDVWCPGRRAVSPDLLSMRAWRPTGPNGARWEAVDALDPTQLTAAAPVPGAHEVVDNAAYLLGIPHWQRAVAAARLDQDLLGAAVLAAAGFEKEPIRPRTRWHRKESA